MAIIYSLVARGAVILSEFASSTGNFSSVTQTILEKIPEGDSKLTYVYDKFLFHYISEKGVIFLCMADEEFGRRIPFAFLEDIKNLFFKSYTKEFYESVPIYGINEFSKVLKSKMEFYSNDPSADKFKQVKGEIAGVKDVMVQNIERVLERGERIDILVDKTDNLNQTSFAFRKRSTALRRSLWWKNTRLKIMLGASIMFILYIIACSICGFPMIDQCLHPQ
ncbi:synaptobrevin-domain-containing protein [Neoconidiobolus thromboides FSU 785]|nr:synaptobrevin-domain-containing protein [Neoconidiobolus thromboides FSU 785]